jgi:excisionase family DNA binding protein
VTDEEGDDGMSPTELAERLGVDRATVHRWVRAGKVRAGRFPSGRRRIPQAEVDRILSELESSE